MSDGLFPPRRPHAGSRTGVRCLSASVAERVRAQAESAEARCEELRWAEVDSRARAGSLKWRLDTCRRKLEAAVEEAKEVRRAAKDALSLKAEVARLEKLLSEAGVEPGKRSTVMSLRMEVARLRKEIDRRDKTIARLEDRLAREAQASETHKETIRWQGREVIRLHAVLRRLRDQAEAVKSLSGEVYRLRVALEVAGTAKERLKARLLRASEAARSRSPSGEAAELRKALRRSRRQKTAIKSLSREKGLLKNLVAEWGAFRLRRWRPPGACGRDGHADGASRRHRHSRQRIDTQQERRRAA